MKQTIVTPNTQEFTSFEALRNPNLPLKTKVTFNLNNGDAVTFELAHKNAYGATNIYVLEDCYGKDYMNSTMTNKGGWSMSDAREHDKRFFDEQFPDELKALIIERTIKQKLHGEILECKDKLWRPSYTEMFGKGYDPEHPALEVDVDDVHFDLYSTEKSRVKELDPHGTWFYWLRSATALNSTYFEDVSDYGSSNSNIAVGSYGVCFGFCI